MSVRPIKDAYTELQQEVKQLNTTNPPREHIERALALVCEMRVSLNDIEWLVKSLHNSLLTFDHFNSDNP
jgi:hypothetical protein